MIGHLRAVKDPFRTALAARSLPDSSKMRVLQVGGAMTAAMAKRARREMELMNVTDGSMNSRNHAFAAF